MKTKTLIPAILCLLIFTKTDAQIDSTPPVIYLNTPYSICHQQNYTYHSQPISYSDNYYPAKQLSVVKTGVVNPYVRGWYEETYTVTDGSGNSASKTRHIVVGDCGLNPKSNLIKGFLYIDNDSNCYYNPLKDQLVDNLKLNISGIDYFFMNTGGRFQFFADSSEKVITPSIPTGWKIKCPIGGTDTWRIANGGDIYFALVPKPEYFNTNIGNQIKSERWNGQVVVRGSRTALTQVISNTGNTKTENMVCQLTVNRKLEYLKHPESPAIYKNSSITFIVPGILPMEKKEFLIDYQVGNKDSGQLTFICSCWTKSKIIELDEENNISIVGLKIVNSHDPNDKQGQSLSETNTQIQDLEYFVRFQNTGTWPATSVIVRDTLSPLLDTNTFRFISASHSAYVERTGYALAFHFIDIELMDSMHNEPESHGWFYYNIKPNPGLQEKQRIYNTAYIYFDAEDAVVTNTTSNFWEIPTANIAVPIVRPMQLYPVPAHDRLNFSMPGAMPGKAQLSIFAGSGKRIMDRSIEISDKGNSLDVSLLPNGIYFMKLAQNGIIYTETFSVRR